MSFMCSPYLSQTIFISLFGVDSIGNNCNWKLPHLIIIPNTIFVQRNIFTNFMQFESENPRVSLYWNNLNDLRRADSRKCLRLDGGEEGRKWAIECETILSGEKQLTAICIDGVSGEMQRPPSYTQNVFSRPIFAFVRQNYMEHDQRPRRNQVIKQCSVYVQLHIEQVVIMKEKQNSKVRRSGSLFSLLDNLLWFNCDWWRPGHGAVSTTFPLFEKR